MAYEQVNGPRHIPQEERMHFPSEQRPDVPHQHMDQYSSNHENPNGFPRDYIASSHSSQGESLSDE